MRYLKNFKYGALAIFLFSTILISTGAEIVNYNWPNSPDLKSTEYSVRIRQIPSSGAPGAWVDLFTFNCIPRNYNSHPVTGDGDGSTEFLEDRTLSFVQFAFTGTIEVEVKKLFGTVAPRVELAPKGYGINPHYFNGKVVRFYLKKWAYVSVNFDSPDNKDDDRFSGDNIKYGMMIFADEPEAVSGDYTPPNPSGTGVVVWSNSTPIETIRNASIIYFPPGDHKMKEHPDSENAYLTNKAAMQAEPLYHGQLRLKKSQKIYVAGGAYVRGCFKTNGYDGVWLYGRGIVSGRDHYQHEVLIPEFDSNGNWIIETATKEAFIDFIGTDDTHFYGVVMMEPFHHTCPSGNRSVIKNIKILGFCSNNDGIRPGNNSLVDGIFIKTSDDYDYARSPHEVKNSVFWPGVNGAVGMLGWNNLGTGFAEYRNNYIINAEWSSADKRNTGVIGSVAKAGIKLEQNILENIYIENPTAFLVNATIDGSGASGYLKNFTFKNIKVEYPFSLPNGNSVKQKLESVSGNPISDFTFTNLIVDGKLVNWNNYREHFDLNLTGSNGTNDDNTKNVHNITFNSQGTIYRITVDSGINGRIYPRGNSGVIDCPAGTSQSISIIPNPGYKIASVSIDGTFVQRIQTCLFTNVTENHTMTVTFAPGDDYFDLSSTAPTFTPAPSPTRTPAPATPSPTPAPLTHLLPGHIEAEDFSNQQGIDTESTGDSGGGLNIGWIHNGDTVEYRVLVEQKGTFLLKLRAASGSAGGTVSLLAGGTAVASINIPGTGGWQKWQTFSTACSLNTGQQTLTLEFSGGTGFLMNLNWLEFSSGILLGDVNNDSAITIVDALITAQYYVGLTPPIDIAAADVNRDGNINIVDALMMAQFYVGLINNF